MAFFLAKEKIVFYSDLLKKIKEKFENLSIDIVRVDRDREDIDTCVSSMFFFFKSIWFTHWESSCTRYSILPS